MADRVKSSAAVVLLPLLYFFGKTFFLPSSDFSVFSTSKISVNRLAFSFWAGAIIWPGVDITLGVVISLTPPAVFQVAPKGCEIDFSNCFEFWNGNGRESTRIFSSDLFCSEIITWPRFWSKRRATFCLIRKRRFWLLDGWKLKWDLLIFFGGSDSAAVF